MTFMDSNGQPRKKKIKDKFQEHIEGKKCKLLIRVTKRGDNMDGLTNNTGAAVCFQHSASCCAQSKFTQLKGRSCGPVMSAIHNAPHMSANGLSKVRTLLAHYPLPLIDMLQVLRPCELEQIMPTLKIMLFIKIL